MRRETPFQFCPFFRGKKSVKLIPGWQAGECSSSQQARKGFRTIQVPQVGGESTRGRGGGAMSPTSPPLPPTQCVYLPPPPQA